MKRSRALFFAKTFLGRFTADPLPARILISTGIAQREVVPNFKLLRTTAGRAAVRAAFRNEIRIRVFHGQRRAPGLAQSEPRL